jgi:hypothetical protein
MVILGEREYIQIDSLDVMQLILSPIEKISFGCFNETIKRRLIKKGFKR